MNLLAAFVLAAPASDPEATEVTVKELLRQVRDCVPTISDPLEHADFSHRLALAYAKAGEREMAATIISDALSSLGTAQRDAARDSLLAMIAESQSRLGMLTAAIATADRIDAEGMKWLALERVADAVAASGRVEEACDVVDRIDDAFYRDTALGTVAEAAAMHADLKHVWPIFKSITCTRERSVAQVLVVLQLLRRGRLDLK